DINGKLYFIDFENTFYTTKWPLVELISNSIIYTNKIEFNNSYLNVYFKNLPADSELWNIDLYKQCRFAVISHSIAVIAQTKWPGKKKDFIDLLNIGLDKKRMRVWYNENIKLAVFP